MSVYISDNLPPSGGAMFIIDTELPESTDTLSDSARFEELHAIE
jgi:hypothetical protein